MYHLLQLIQHRTPMQQPNSVANTPLPWILKTCAIKRYDSFRSTCNMTAVSLLMSREQRYIKAININNGSTVYTSLANLHIMHNLYNQKHRKM